jgi:hypothetical protein
MTDMDSAMTNVLFVHGIRSDPTTFDWAAALDAALGRRGTGRLADRGIGTVAVSWDDALYGPEPVEDPGPPDWTHGKRDDAAYDSAVGRWSLRQVQVEGTLRRRGSLRSGPLGTLPDQALDSPVTMTIKSIELERLPPLSGESVVLCSEGGGDVGSQYISLDLSAHPPNFKFYDDRYQPTAPFTFAPERNAPVVANIVVNAGGSPLGTPDHRRYRWTMRLHYSLAKHSYSQRIDNDGRSFDITT